MQNLSLGNKDKINKGLNDAYNEAKKDPRFSKLIKNLKVDDDVAMKYTSKLEDTLVELDHCNNCRGLFECKNRVEGHVYYPENVEEKIIFSYAPCKYYNECQKKLNNKMTSSKELDNARIKDIDIEDKNRVKLIKWIKEFYDSYDVGKTMKGLYLHGSFGSGKTFLLAALLNELRLNKKVRTEIIYFPELLRTLKDDWDFFGGKMEYLKSVDILLIDDIGAEKVTEWGRDEVLGTILQSRMNNNLCTFFTSNLSIDELERHLSLTKNSEDTVKSRRIIERVKQLTNDMELISENRRK